MKKLVTFLLFVTAMFFVFSNSIILKVNGMSDDTSTITQKEAITR